MRSSAFTIASNWCSLRSIGDYAFRLRLLQHSYGLKGPQVDVNGDGIIDTIPYNKDANSDATNATNVAQVLIPDNVKHSQAHILGG